MSRIQFVDERDVPIGAGSKAEALEQGIYHRIVRVFLINSHGEILMQKRAAHLKSGPGLWDQSAGGHVDEGESYEEAAKREMKEELGLEGLELKEVGHYFLAEPYKDGEKKRFHAVYIATYNGEVHANPEEVSETRWMQQGELTTLMVEHPELFPVGCIYAYQEIVLKSELLKDKVV